MRQLGFLAKPAPIMFGSGAWVGVWLSIPVWENTSISALGAVRVRRVGTTFIWLGCTAFGGGVPLCGLHCDPVVMLQHQRLSRSPPPLTPQT